MIADDSTGRTVFVSYSHRDKDYLERLQEHLKPHMRAGTIRLWVDTQIEPSDNWHEQIKQALVSAQVAILLVSASYLASDFVAEEELPKLLAAAEERGARILPVLVTPCSFRHTKLSRFQAINDPKRPLSLMRPEEQDVIWVKVVEWVLKTLEPKSDPLPIVVGSQIRSARNTLFLTLTRPAHVVNWLNMLLGAAAFLAIVFALVMSKIAPDQFDLINTIGISAYSLSALICCSELYVLAVYRQWSWFVGLLIVGIGVYLSNSIFVLGGPIYFVAASVPLVFSFGWSFTSGRTVIIKH